MMKLKLNFLLIKAFLYSFLCTQSSTHFFRENFINIITSYMNVYWRQCYITLKINSNRVLHSYNMCHYWCNVEYQIDLTHLLYNVKSEGYKLFRLFVMIGIVDFFEIWTHSDIDWLFLIWYVDSHINVNSFYWWMILIVSLLFSMYEILFPNDLFYGFIKIMTTIIHKLNNIARVTRINICPT